MSNYRYYYCAYNRQTGEQIGRLHNSYERAEDRASYAKHIYGVACIAVLGDGFLIPPGFKFNPRHLTDEEKARFNVKE